MKNGLAFRPGRLLDERLPLSRFLPPYLAGAASAWLRDNIEPGAWVLDPFGTSPYLPLEIAGAGYRVIVAANNPIIRHLLEDAANPPNRQQFQPAIAHLAESRTGEERLEPHLLSLYNTPCGQCGTVVSADAFLWQREDEAPFARIYNCPNCGQSGQFPAVDFDAAQAERTAATPLHIGRALARVASPDDPDRRFVAEAISYYPPRAVYALFSLINKLDTLSEPDQRLLRLLLLVTLDRTNTLWPHPSERPRPKQLTIPPAYYERNVFKEMEKAVEIWERLKTRQVEITRFPQIPSGPSGICLYEGRIRKLSGQIETVDLSAIVSAVPRPNQAFWTLSALWAGWLWGAGAVEHFKPVLRRQRYDWRWHTTALHAAFSHIREGPGLSVPFFALLPESESGFLNAFITAAKTAGLNQVEPAVRHQAGQAQLALTMGAAVPAPALEIDNVVDSASSYLLARGEPAPFSALVSAVGADLDLESVLSPDRKAADVHSNLLDLNEQALTFRAGFLRYNAGKDVDVGTWWLREDNPESLPLADRVEAAVREILIGEPGISFSALDAAVCQRFPGSLTPEEDIVLAALESYGLQNEAGGWLLRPEDDPGDRRRDQVTVGESLVRMGRRLGFVVQQGTPTTWRDDNGLYRFYVITTAGLAETVYTNAPRPGKTYLVVPGSRANLILHKRRRDPRLDYALQQWDFIKFRALRDLADNPATSRENLEVQLGLDDFRYETPQMRLL